MADRLKRGSAPGRARSEDQRPGSFKKGHKKRGGRQRGTPNKFSAEYKKDIFEAAHRVGMDANGTLGDSRVSPVDCQTLPADYGWPARQPDGVARARDRTATEAAPAGEQFDEVAGVFWIRQATTKHSQNPLSPVSARSDRTQELDAAANGTRSDPFDAEAHQKQGADAEGEPTP